MAGARLSVRAAVTRTVGLLAARRNVIAAIATGAVAVLLAMATAGRGCSASDATPDGVVRAFVAAAQAGDRQAVWDLLGPATRQQLEASARGATEKVGGAQRFSPVDMLEIAVREGQRRPVSVSVRERGGDGASAVVEVEGEGGRRDRLRVVQVDGRWRVELDFIPTNH